jgi:uncharacterized protein YbcI
LTLPTSPAPRYGGSIAAAISDAVVGLLREYTGRGPTRVRTTFGPDMIVVAMRNCLTRSERILARRGLTAEVLTTRRAVHNAMRDELSSAVHAVTGDRVEAYFADTQCDPTSRSRCSSCTRATAIYQ